MKLGKQGRGPRLFDRWKDEGEPLHCALGSLRVEMHTEMDATPDDRMHAMALDLMTYIASHDENLLDLIWAHYVFARREGWLSVWQVSADITRDTVLAHVLSFTPSVSRFEGEYDVGLQANIAWDQEHKLWFGVQDGKLWLINESEEWSIDPDGALRLNG